MYNIYIVPHGDGKMHVLKVANPAGNPFVVVELSTLSFPSCQNSQTAILDHTLVHQKPVLNSK